MRRTYIDAGVLIAAARGIEPLSSKARSILTDAGREFVCSDYVKLEVAPKATYFHREPEVRFYESFFATAITWRRFDAIDLEMALVEACESGLSAMDAVHVVVAATSKCDELITLEKPGRPIHRTKLIAVTSIDF